MYTCLNALLSLSFLLIVSCTTGQQADPIDAPSQVLEEVVNEISTDPLFEVGLSIPTEWWTLFQDEQLTDFILTTLENNPTLKEAQAKISLAEAKAQQMRAALYPFIYWGGDVSRQKLSETGLAFPQNPSATSGSTVIPAAGITPLPPGPTPPNIPATGGAVGLPVYFTQWETELNLFYDFDVWKKNRNTLKAAIGEMYASRADEIFSRLQLSIAVAQLYYDLQIDLKREEIAQRLVDNQNAYLKLVQMRLEGSLGTQPTVYNQQLSVTTATQSLLQIQADSAVKEYKLKAYLAGSFDEIIGEIKIDPCALPRIPLPENLPLNLLSFRPDITAQLWLIESAGKRIDVAKAGFYPDFNLTALAGFQTIRWHKLFEGRSTYFNVDPAFSLPIFEGGRLSANLYESEVNYDIAIYKYNDLVLNAVREVLESIAILRNSEEQLHESRRNLEYQTDLFKITEQLVENNLKSELDYLTSQQSVLIAQDQEMIVLGRKIQALLALIKALGGGYETCN